MKTIEFRGCCRTRRANFDSPGYRTGIAPGEPLRIVLQWGESGEGDAAWRAAGRQRSEAAYAPEDAVYEELTRD